MYFMYVLYVLYIMDIILYIKINESFDIISPIFNRVSK